MIIIEALGLRVCANAMLERKRISQETFSSLFPNMVWAKFEGLACKLNPQLPKPALL
jgi:hypothetical protein